MDGRIMRCGITSSCQSAATSEIVKRSWACVHRGAALYQVPDLYLLYAVFHAVAAGNGRAWIPQKMDGWANYSELKRVTISYCIYYGLTPQILTERPLGIACVVNKLRCIMTLWLIRSLREAVAGSQWKANSEEKDDDQKMHAKSVLQRVVQLRSSIRTDTGRPRQN